jgi:quercetin dioxygenase-like cupin family protein
VRSLARFVLTLLICAAPTISAQDPLKVLPDSYKLQIENDWVRVMRVHYPPHAKLAAHDHTKAAAAYVYLNNGGPVLFKHVGLSYGAVQRPATVDGAFRLYQAVDEVHEVENPNDTPSDFLRVEFKTEPLGARRLRGRYPPEPYPAGENYSKVQFQNEQVRVTRLACAPQKPCDLSPEATLPALLVSLTPARVGLANGEPWTVEKGQSEWLPVGSKRVVENKEKQPAEFLLFELKTAPVKPAL